MIIKLYDDGRMAEIIIKSTAKPICADELVRVMLAHGVTAAKIINPGEIQKFKTGSRTQTMEDKPAT